MRVSRRPVRNCASTSGSWSRVRGSWKTTTSLRRCGFVMSVSAPACTLLPPWSIDHARMFGLRPGPSRDRRTTADLWRNLALSTAGNIGGGVFLIAFTHSAQVKAAR